MPRQQTAKQYVQSLIPGIKARYGAKSVLKHRHIKEYEWRVEDWAKTYDHIFLGHGPTEKLAWEEAKKTIDGELAKRALTVSE